MQQLMFGQLRETIPEGETLYISGKEIAEYSIRADLPSDSVEEALMILLGLDPRYGSIDMNNYVWVNNNDAGIKHGGISPHKMEKSYSYEELLTILLDYAGNGQHGIHVVDGEYFSYDPTDEDPEQGFDLLIDEYVINEWDGGEISDGVAVALVVKSDSSFFHCSCGEGASTLISPVRVAAKTSHHLVVKTIDGEICIKIHNMLKALPVSQAIIAHEVDGTVGGALSGLQLANIITNYITN